MSQLGCEQVEATVRAVIGQTFKLSAAEIAGELRMGDPAAWDSMGHMELIASLEDAFKWSCPGHLIADLTDVTSIVKAVSGQAD